MVEEVSPIIYKKIDVSTFSRHGIDEVEQFLFFDNISKQLIQICSSGIKIFNKSATQLKKEINLQLNKDDIYKIAVDKQIKYMLIFLEKNGQKIILVVNLQKGNVIKILSDHLNILLGMFFIFNTQTLSFNEDDNIYFLLIYKDKIEYYEIAKIKQKNEIIEEVNLITEQNYPNLISKFIYNPIYMILCIQKQNNTQSFDLYNLSNVKYFTIPFYFEIKKKGIQNSNNDSPSVIKSLFGLIGNKGERLEYNGPPLINTKDNYKENHFFLESIYNNLYLIYVNYEEGYIQFFHIISLYEIKKVYEVQFENQHENTLQIIDNLCLLHNFDKMQTTIIDLNCETEDKVLFKKFPISSYEILNENKKKTDKMISVKIDDYLITDDKTEKPIDFKFKINVKYNFVDTISMLTYTNTIFYNKDIKINGSIVEEKNEKSPNCYILYKIYFDPLIYYDNSSSKFDALLNLTRRKHGKEVIIHGLYELIKSGKNIQLIKGIYKRIVNQIVSNRLYNNNNKFIMTQERRNKSKMLLNQFEEYREPSELPIPFQYTILKKTDLINQIDIYYKLFKVFEFNKNVKPDYIINVFLLFIDELRIQNVKIHPSANEILIMYLKKVKNLFLENIFYQYSSIPISEDLANYLIEDIVFNKEIYYDKEIKNECIQHAEDILIRLGKYEKIFCLFIRMNRLTEAVHLAKRYELLKKNFTSKEIDMIKKAFIKNPILVESVINEFESNDFFNFV